MYLQIRIFYAISIDYTYMFYIVLSTNTECATTHYKLNFIKLKKYN